MKCLNKALVVLVIIFFFLAMPVQAKGIFTPVLTGSVTNANMTITLTAGSADIDFTDANIPRDYKGHLAKICDSALKCAQGYIGTDGAGTVQNIVNSKGGTTRNWISDSGINADDAAGYTYTLLKSNQSVVVASGAIAQADNRGDYTATNAFYWPGLDWSAYQDGNHFLVVYDSGGLGAGGFISATAPVGDGAGNELLGSELVDAWTNRVASGYETFTPGIGNLIDVVNTTGYGICYKNLSISRKVLKYTHAYTLNSGEIPHLRLLDSGENSNNVYEFSLSTTAYINAPVSAGAVGFVNGTTSNWSLTNFTFKQVTDPPPTGVRIVSAKGGATRNWTFKNSSFNPNTAATYKIYYLGD